MYSNQLWVRPEVPVMCRIAVSLLLQLSVPDLLTRHRVLFANLLDGNLLIGANCAYAEAPVRSLLQSYQLPASSCSSLVLLSSFAADPRSRVTNCFRPVGCVPSHFDRNTTTAMGFRTRSQSSDNRKKPE